MRDIRQDLKERLEAIAVDRAALQKQVEALATREASINAMLAEEERRIRNLSTQSLRLPFSHTPLVGGMQITDLIRVAFTGDRQRLTFEEVKDLIVRMSFNFEGQKPGRVVHGGLLSLIRTGEIDKDETGRYGLHASNGLPVQEEQPTQ